MAVFRINNEQPEVLLGLRASNPGRGRWTFPGGGAEGREKLSKAAVREFQEETGVQLYGRYIAKVGLFNIKNFFFEWSTLIIESAQYISTKKHFKENRQKGCDLIDGEFVSLRWIPLSEIGKYKLHRWVKDVINFYLSGKMKPYTTKSSKGVSKALPESERAAASKSARRESIKNLFFDMAETILIKLGSQSKRRIGEKKLSAGQDADGSRLTKGAISAATH